MKYNKTTWIDDVTALDAEHLNNIEDGIENIYKATINGKQLSDNPSLTAADVGALPASTEIPTTDKNFSATSENAQSGIAVAEAVATKANLQFKEISVEGAYVLTDLIEGAHICELSEVVSIDGIGYELYFTNGMGINVGLNNYPFTIGKKYLIETHDYLVDVIAEVIDLEDKVNIADIDQTYNPESPNAQSGIAVAEALSNVGGCIAWKKIVDITTTGELNGIDATTEEFPNLAKCNEFITRLILPKTETALTLGAIRFFINDSWFFRVNTASTVTSGLAEIRCHTIIADTLIHTVGNESTRGHANVVGGTNILASNQFVDIPQEIRVALNDTTKYLPIGTQFVIYGKVEG